MKKLILSLFILACYLQAVVSQTKQSCHIEKTLWGETRDQTVWLFTLQNKHGVSIKVSNFGATLTWVSVPDKTGKFENVVLGFDSLSGYLGMHPMFGSTVGRFANRIGGAQFELNGITYKLNGFGGVAMHGGMKGFSRQVFEVDTSFANTDSAVVAFRYISPDMEEGYPGRLTTIITFVLNNENEVKLQYMATTDKPTVINFTNHAYFNLTGCKASVLDHELKMMSDSVTLTDEQLVPTGEIAPVAGTAYDFIVAHKIGERIGEIEPGYDINYVLRKVGNELSMVAAVYEPQSGRYLQAYTTEPGVQFYTGNSLSEKITGHDGKAYGPHYGFCLEMQHFPDSPNKPAFPSTVLNPGETYRQTTIYRFSIM